MSVVPIRDNEGVTTLPLPLLPSELHRGEPLHPALRGFHPAVAEWFRRRFPEGPTTPQAEGWPHVEAGRDTLIAAPTGSGKTLAGFMVCIDRLYRAHERGEAVDGLTRVVYVSPLKALAVDIAENLERPLGEIADLAAELGLAAPRIRVAVRTGDTTSSERAAMLRKPPSFVVTTPESLYLLVTSDKGRELLRTVETVIVDEIHAVARDKRGAHLALTLERLEALCDTRPHRIGLSATQRPIETVGRLLVGDRPLPAIVDAGHQRDLDLALELPEGELEAVTSAEQMSDVLDRIAALVEQHRTTIVFVNTRRLAERLAHQLGERLGDDVVAAHHGSLSKERRYRVETRLRAGDLRALVATASLELGIDIGPVELVCQIGSPRSIATFLQRVGRSNHSRAGTPKGRLYPLTARRARRVHRAPRRGAGGSARRHPAARPAARHRRAADRRRSGRAGVEDRRAVRARPPRRAVHRDDPRAVRRGRRPRQQRHRHRSRRTGRVRAPRLGQRRAARSQGRAPRRGHLGRCDPGERRLPRRGRARRHLHRHRQRGLGGRVDGGRHLPARHPLMADPQGGGRRGAGARRRRRAPNVPFWMGEAPARTAELSQEVSQLRATVDTFLAAGDPDGARQWLVDTAGIAREPATMVVDYLAVARAVLGAMPTQEQLVLERFFDETGGMQLVVHSPYGGRINRALGLALRKKFCRTFNFELQAAASDDAIVLSLGPHHSFPLQEVPGYLSSATVDDTLQHAILDSPMFQARWRWNLNRSLMVLRFRGGRRNPPPIQRMESDDLMAAVFPQAAACQENVTGPIEIPDHVLVRQTISDTLHEALDVDGVRDLLQRMESGAVTVHYADTTEPSVLAHEILTARPYAFLDDEELQNRRTNAVTLRRGLAVDLASIGALDPAAVDQVHGEITPEPDSADDLHDLLSSLVVCRPRPEWQERFDELAARGRASVLEHRGQDALVHHRTARRRRPRVRRRRRCCGRDPARSPRDHRYHHRRRAGVVDHAHRRARAGRAGLPRAERLRAPGALPRPGGRHRVGVASVAGAHALVLPAYPPGRGGTGDRPGLHALPAALAACRPRHPAHR